MPLRRVVRCALLAGAVVLAVDAADAPARGRLSPELGLPLARHFSSDDYDGFSRVTAVTHTAEGFTLFGTYHAAILFDGVTHEKIPVPATYVTALCRDEAGRIWVGGDNEVGLITTEGDGALRYVSQTSRLPPAAASFGRMRALVSGRDGVFAATSTGLLRFTADRVDFLPLAPDSRPQLFVLGGRVYLQSQGGLQRFDQGEFRELESFRRWAGREIQLWESDAGGVQAVIEREGLFAVDLRAGRWEKLTTPLDALVAEPLVRVLRLRDGRVVFIRTDNRGVVVADPSLQSAQVLDARTGLAHTAILNAALDADDGLWLGSANGLVRLDLGTGVSVFDERNAFPIGSASSLVRHRGVLYAGSTQGLMRLQPGDPASGQPARFVADPRVTEVCDNLRDAPEGLLFSTNDAVELLDGAGRRRVLEAPAKVSMIKASRLSPGRYFVATADGGFHVLHLPTGRHQRALTLPPGVIPWNLAEEADGSLWIGTGASGFWRITAQSGGWTEATAQAFPLGQAGLPAGTSWTGVFPLFDDLHFLTENGMYRWRATTRDFVLDERFRAEGGRQLRFMPVVADPVGRVWTSLWFGTVACARPLGYFQAAASNTYVWRDAPARWQAGVGRFGAGLLMVENDEGRTLLWTKSPTSIARIELETLPAAGARLAPRPRLRRLQTGDRSWSMAGADPVRLPFSTEPITLRYAAPDYRPGAALKYQTRLRGFREEWSAPASAQETVFTNLIGGPFTFEVRSIDADGVVSETTRLVFSVAPPWHRSAPALACYGVALIGGMAGFIRWRLRQGERERVRLEQLVAQRTEELRQAKDAADEANRAKSVFLATMSHELRTPLNGVIGYAQVLMKDRDLSPRNRERVQVVQASGEHLLRVINEVLDFSKIEAGKLELAVTAFHLPALLRDVVAAVQPRLEQKALAFRYEPSAELPELVRGDPLKLRQILENLISNAVKFTSRGTIRLVVEPIGAKAESLRFAISDTGVGISASDRAKLFQPFQQVADGRPPEPGTGLGLAISQRLVKLMGGALEVESTPGEGSTFSFAVALPRVSDAPVESTETVRRITGYRGSRRRVLVVDDVATNRDVLRELLGPVGFEVEEAASGEEALARATASPPHLVLLDLRMPGIDGCEVARRLRSLSGAPRPAVIAMSASAFSFTRAEAVAAGCDDFVPKPFRAEELFQRVGVALQLDWTDEDASGPAEAEAAANGTSLVPPAVQEEWLACARRGEISQLRRLLAAYPTDPLARQLEGLARTYRMEQIRALLEAQLARPEPVSAPPPSA